MTRGYVQATLADPSAARKARARFEALESELATIGAKVRIAMATHDDVHFDITCPPGSESAAEAILRKHFPVDSTDVQG